MSESNTTDFSHPSVFILLGIPGLETYHGWISIPFCIMYIVALLGNFTILFVVKMESSLHEPMYYFLCMLAVTDLVLSTSILPKMLSVFWFNSREISFNGCLTQLFFFHCFITMESGIFVAMALDRYVAICHPLRHSTILTSPVVGKLCLAVGLRATFIILPCVFLAKQWLYCKSNLVSLPYCVHIAVVTLACGDFSASSYYGLFVLFWIYGLDVILIAVSYFQILSAIFRLPTKDARLKTFGTCGSHLCATVVFYIPSFFFSILSRFDKKKPHPLQLLFNNLCTLMPLMLNSIIYGVKTKQIWDRLLKLFIQKVS